MSQRGGQASLVDATPGPSPAIHLREIDLNITNRCNLECIYCSFSSTPSRAEPEIPPREVHTLLDRAAAMGVRVIHFSGGEPIIRADMPEFIAHATDLGFKMRMHSNGSLFTETRLRKVWDAGLRQVLISLDGFAANHDFHRAKPGLYAKTLQGISNAVAMGFSVRVNAVATTLNVDEIPALLPMLAGMGVNTFTVFYQIAVGRGRQQRALMVPPLRWRQFVHDMRRMAAAHKPDHMEVTVEKVFLWEEEWEQQLHATGRGGTCLGFLKECDYVNILADGRVYPCVCLVDEAPPIGNIFERPLHEMLEDPAGWTFYGGLASGLNSVCRSCELLDACRGGCRSFSRAGANDWFAMDPRCSGAPRVQGFMPVCFMLRENVDTGTRSGFQEHL
ncbi:MAG: radical SAM protein [Alphaproteobacteria bacterium]|nr:radical SAM protein [Alphaproteobacteria bacterium]